MASILLPTATLIGGGLSAAGSLASGMMGSGAATDAAGIQAGAADRATQMQLAMFREIQDNLRPWVQAGQSTLPILQRMTGTNPGGNPLTAPLTAPFNPTMAQLESTPGYQFVKSQGLQAAQNGFAAQGLASSGAALKGATTYAEGLAGTTFQQMLDNYLKQNLQTYNMLGGISGSGQNAAAQTGSLGLNATQGAASTMLSGANAAASGIIGSNNALTAGLTGGLSGVTSGVFSNSLFNSGMFGNLGGSGGAAAYNSAVRPNDLGTYIPNNLT